jgi:hypothetical protein
MMTKSKIKKALERQFKISMVVILIVTAVSVISNMI